jgi:osmotically-inducible protein OsmY
MKDLDLQQNVMDELNWEPSVNAAHIGVAASDGVVTLTGTVSSYAEKDAAESAAGRVYGVKGIADELKVVYPSDKQVDDASIAKRALQVLSWDAMIPDTVKVRVERGWLTLSGETSWNYQRDAAAFDVQKLSGVVGVTNEITIKPTVQASVVKEQIVGALGRNAQIEAENIIVTTDGGRVTLAGDVDTWYERDLAETTAWSAAGVTQVSNKLTVI